MHDQSVGGMNNILIMAFHDVRATMTTIGATMAITLNP